MEVACEALAEACGEPLPAAALDLYMRVVTRPALLELPPVVTAEIQLRLLVQLGIVSEVSLWRGSAGGGVECVFALGSRPDARAESARSAATALR